MNKLKSTLTFLVVFMGLIGLAQEETLLIVEDDSITTQEFLRVYYKNLDLVQDERQKDIEGYLELFIEYQLKLKEAERLGLDKDPQYIREFNRYKRQLTKNYLVDHKVTENLVKEAYERSTYDVNASHILVMLNESVTDTISTYNRIMGLRDRVLKEGMDKVKAAVHNGKTIFVEDLGYFSAFKMVYDFETAAFNTKVGEVSMPFRTQFGYHIVKVNDKRPSRGTITAAHIMVALEQKDSTIHPEERIKDIYKRLEQGEAFESLAKQFSDDKSSANNGGRLQAFKSGQLSSAKFEDMAFALEADGKYTRPFKTKFGWHIVKRLKLEPIQEYDEMKAALENRVKRDARSRIINEAMVNDLKATYDITINEDAKVYFINILDDSYFNRKWNIPADIKDGVVFTINSKTYSIKDFADHINAMQRMYVNKPAPLKTVVEKEFNNFFNRSILKYRENNLKNENQEFAAILKEYKEGLLLFELMEQEIWNKASKDSVGLQTFYETHKNQYQWKERVDVVIASLSNKSDAKEVQRLLKNQTTADAIKLQMNTEDEQRVIFTSGTFELDHSSLPSNLKLKEGVSKIYKHNDAFHVLKIKEILPAQTKTLEEAKGAVITDYQEQLEKEWINNLRNRFKVEVNESVFKNMKANIKS